jgi:hypothetical protein
VTENQARKTGSLLCGERDFRRDVILSKYTSGKFKKLYIYLI